MIELLSNRLRGAKHIGVEYDLVRTGRRVGLGNGGAESPRASIIQNREDRNLGQERSVLQQFQSQRFP